MICECYAPKCGDVLKSWIVPVLDALEVGLCIFPWSGIGILFLVSSMYLQIQNESMEEGENAVRYMKQVKNLFYLVMYTVIPVP